MTTALSPTPRLQFIDEDGAPIAGGKVYTYVGGTMSTPLATYTDYAGGTPNANPVILDSSGRASIWLTPNTLYDFQITDANDVLIYTVSNLSALSFTGSPVFGDITIAGNETFTGNGRRIKGDMTNTPAVNRLSMQTSIANSTTEFQILPSGSGGAAAVSVFADALVASGNFGRMSVSSTEVLIEANKLSGTYPKLVLNTGGADNWQMSNGGVVTVANPVAFSVNRAGSSFSVVNDTVTAVDWTAEAFDTNNSFDLTTDRFTPPAGYYQLSGCGTQLDDALADGIIAVDLYKNGSPLHNGARVPTGTYSHPAANFSATVYANGTDYFDMRVYQANNGAAGATWSGTLVELYFCGHKVG